VRGNLRGTARSGRPGTSAAGRRATHSVSPPTPNETATNVAGVTKEKASGRGTARRQLGVAGLVASRQRHEPAALRGAPFVYGAAACLPVPQLPTAPDHLGSRARARALACARAHETPQTDAARGQLPRPAPHASDAGASCSRQHASPGPPRWRSQSYTDPLLRSRRRRLVGGSAKCPKETAAVGGGGRDRSTAPFYPPMAALSNQSLTCAAGARWRSRPVPPFFARPCFLALVRAWSSKGEKG